MVEIKLPGLDVLIDSHRDGKVAQWVALESAVNTGNKRSQVEKHSVSLRKFMQNLYGIEFKVYRGVAHYNADSGIALDAGDGELGIDLDFLIMILGLHPDVLESLKREEIEALSYIGLSPKDGRKKTNTKKRDSNRIRALLENKDSRKLYKIITNEGDNDHYSKFRGGLSELGVTKAMQLAVQRIEGTGTDEIIFIPDYNIPSRTKMEEVGLMPQNSPTYIHRQVDGIFIFYKKERFRKLLDTLREYFPTTLKVEYNGSLA